MKISKHSLPLRLSLGVVIVLHVFYELETNELSKHHQKIFKTLSTCSSRCQPTTDGNDNYPDYEKEPMNLWDIGTIYDVILKINIEFSI